MSQATVEELFRKVMRQSPADRLRLAAALLETQPSKAEMAVSIAKSAIDEVSIPIVLGKLSRRDPAVEKGPKP